MLAESLKVVYLGVSVLSALLAAPVAPAGDWPPAPPLATEFDDEAGHLPPSVTAEMVPGGVWNCTFRYKAGPDAARVSVAGTFNGWNSTATPMRGPRGDGYWLATVEIPPGRHEYKFVVNNSLWSIDPDNPDSCDDNHSGRNSVLKLGRVANLSVSDGRRGDGKVSAAGFEHRPDLPIYFQPLAPDQVLVRVRMLATDLQRVWVAQKRGAATEMHLARPGELFDLYEATMTLAEPPSGNVSTARYTFIFQDGTTKVSAPHEFSKSFTRAHVFATPVWAQNAVWYQIMPERFRNGDKANDAEVITPWTSDWFTPQPWEQKLEDEGRSFYDWYVFDRNYGGDLAGIEDKLPYLEQLGVNALYLMPVFIATSSHNYNAMNYLHIDPELGAADDDYERIAAAEDLNDPKTWKWTKSDRRFLDFLRAAHNAGFHVIIDGVFNHVGTEHPAFQDVMANGRDSRFADWFDVRSWEPFEYSGWGGFGALPEFKKKADGLASDAAKAHIFNVTRRWMDPDGDGDPSDGVDGWRLDVPGSIPAPFWEEWRALVKSINPEAYITGEIWERADEWLDGKHFDAVMNYQFAHAVVAWVINQREKISASVLDRRLADLRLAYPLPATLVMQNLMDSHDTDRLVSMVLNPDRVYDDGNRIQDNGPSYNNAKPSPADYQRARLIALIQMTYIGAPLVYYGDEAGMWGADDPTCRKPMLWKDLEPYEKPEQNFVMDQHLAFYRQAIALRNAHPALRTGTFETLLADDEADVWAFLRTNADEQLMAVFNPSTEPRAVKIPLPEHAARKWSIVFGDSPTAPKFDDGASALSVSVAPVSGLVLHAATPR